MHGGVLAPIAVASTFADYFIYAGGRDITSRVDMSTVEIVRTLDTTQNGQMQFRVADPDLTLVNLLIEGTEVVFQDTSRSGYIWNLDEWVPSYPFGGYITQITKTSAFGTGLFIDVTCVDYGVLLDAPVVISFKPGKDGDSLGSAVQSLIGNYTQLTAIANTDIGTDRDNYATVEALASQASIPTMPTLDQVSVRDGIKALYEVADRTASTTTSTTSTTTKTKTLACTADATVALIGGSNLGGGADAHMPVGLYSTATYRSFLKFSLSWSGVTKIVSARLYLKTSSQTHLAFGSTPRVLIQRATTSWSEGTVNADGGGSWSSGNAVVYPGPTRTTTGQTDSGTITGSENKWVSYDITSIIESWAPATVQKRTGLPGDGTTNNGLGLVSFDEASSTRTTEFYSRNSSYDPYVVLTYQQTTSSTTTTTTGTDAPVGEIMLYVDAQKHVWSYLADTNYDGSAPFVITDNPTDATFTNAIAATSVEGSAEAVDRYTAVYVVGGNAAGTGWVRGDTGAYPFEKQATISDTSILTATARDAAGQAFLNQHTSDPQIRVEFTDDDRWTTTGPDGAIVTGSRAEWRVGQKVNIYNTALFGAEGAVGRIAELTRRFIPSSAKMSTYSIVVAPIRAKPTATRRLVDRPRRS